MVEENLEERVNHPKWYTSHSSGIECIDLIEHLPCNLANAVKYIWRCGLKMSETPLRELKSAKWYVEREDRRWALYGIESPSSELDVVWRAVARRVILADGADQTTLASFLDALLDYDFTGMAEVLDESIREAEAALAMHEAAVTMAVREAEAAKESK